MSYQRNERNEEVSRTHALPPALAVLIERTSAETQRKEVGTVSRLPLLLAAGALWLFLAALPAFADGGPHVAVTNNGSTVLTSDTCAGCHRIHTGKGE